MDHAADFVESITCNPQDPIEPFLARHSPLTAHACWVWVRAPNIKDDSNQETAIDQEAFQSGLSWLSSRGDAVTIDDVNTVARNSCCTSGKWKVRVLEDQLQRIWGRIARAVYSGSLKVCSGAKVSTRTTQEVRNRGTDHTVYVYVNNYLDEESVADLRSSLEQLLLNRGDDDDTASKPRAKLAQFNPDIFSYMGWGTGKMSPLISAYHCLEPLCAACGKREENGKRLKKCTACRQASYCDVNCQRSHWKVHRPMCRKASK